MEIKEVSDFSGYAACKISVDTKEIITQLADLAEFITEEADDDIVS